MEATILRSECEKAPKAKRHQGERQRCTEYWIVKNVARKHAIWADKKARRVFRHAKILDKPATHEQLKTNRAHWNPSKIVHQDKSQNLITQKQSQQEQPDMEYSSGHPWCPITKTTIQQKSAGQHTTLNTHIRVHTKKFFQKWWRTFYEIRTSTKRKPTHHSSTQITHLLRLHALNGRDVDDDAAARLGCALGFQLLVLGEHDWNGLRRGGGGGGRDWAERSKALNWIELEELCVKRKERRKNSCEFVQTIQKADKFFDISLAAAAALLFVCFFAYVLHKKAPLARMVRINTLLRLTASCSS